jgi:hypothetical protein
MTNPPGYPPPYYYIPPKHPQSTTAMVLGILGLAVCGILAPFAWSIGSKTVREIDANPAAYSGRGEANAGKIMGIVGSVILIGSIVAMVGFFALAFAVDSGSEYFIGGLL